MVRKPALWVALAATLLSVGAPVGTASAASLPPIKHVFVVVLENKGADQTWAQTSPAAYLAKTLRVQGKLLNGYWGTGHASLDNYVAMISGQPPNVVTQADCVNYLPFAGAVGPDGIAAGQGCVYPPTVQTVADQLEAKGLRWKGYMEDMGNDPVRDNGVTCAHPVLGTSDRSQAAAANDQYATRHNPFVYFQSIIDEPSCATNVVPLSRLPADLATAATTPNLVFVTPNLCNDGHDTGCANGAPGGLVSIGTFMAAWAPRILASPAFLKDGVLIVTFDEAETGDASACCNEPTGPNTLAPGIGGPGGGRVGALVVSRFVKAATANDTPYNHYSLLRSIEDIFGLSHLGYANAAGLQSFGGDVFDQPLGPPQLGFARNDATTTTAARVLARSGGSPWELWPAAALVMAAAGIAVARRRRPTA